MNDTYPPLSPSGFPHIHECNHETQARNAHYKDPVHRYLPPQLKKDFPRVYPPDYPVHFETLNKQLEESQWQAERLPSEVRDLMKERKLVFNEANRGIASLHHTWKNLINFNAVKMIVNDDISVLLISHDADY